MLQTSGYILRVIWACAKKDIKSALSERAFTIAGIFIPVNVLILMSLFVLGGSNAPTVVVMNDRGPYAQQLYAAMSHAHSFRLLQVNAQDARNLITGGHVVAVVNIPADFDARIRQNQPVQLDVEIDNLNVDFTNDIRRAVPLSITSFYANAFPHVVNVVPEEHDVYAQDMDYIPYLTVSILVIGLMIGALLPAGVGSAREWERETMKELLLAPAPRWAILVGKMLGAYLVSLVSVILLLTVLIFVIGVRPVNWWEVIGFTLFMLMIFIAIGTLLGTLIKQRQAVVALSLGIFIPLFFLSGAFGPISFTTPVIQVLARIFPVYYAIVLQQHAFHNFTINTLGISMNALILCGYGIMVVILATLILRHSTVAH